MRSTDSASAGDLGSILELRQDSESLADILMKTGLPGTAFRAVALVESTLLLAKGRRRLTMDVMSFEDVGIGGGSSVLTRGVESAVLVAYVVTLKRETGCSRDCLGKFTSLSASRNLRSIEEMESFCLSCALLSSLQLLKVCISVCDDTGMVSCFGGSDSLVVGIDDDRVGITEDWGEKEVGDVKKRGGLLPPS